MRSAFFQRSRRTDFSSFFFLSRAEIIGLCMGKIADAALRSRGKKNISFIGEHRYTRLN